MFILKKYNNLLEFDKVILYLSLFYYIFHNMSVEVSGKYLYLLLSSIATLYMIFRLKNFNVDKYFLVFTASFIFVVLILYFAVSGFLGEHGRFVTGASMYLGVFVFVIFFYSSMRSNYYSWFAPMRILFWILLLSIYIEFIYINILNGDPMSVPYYAVENEKFTLDAISILGYSPAVGLLGMRQMSASFLVVLFWLSGWFNGKKDWLNPHFILLVIALVMAFSGTAVITFVLSLLFYVQRKFSVLLLIMIITSLLILENTGWFSKISYEYILLVIVDIKFQQIVDAIIPLINEPLLFLIGGSITVSKDFSMLKLVTDLGVLPLMLNILFLLAILKRAYKVFSYNEYKNIKLAIFVVFISTFHYPVLFTVPAQALLAYLFVMLIKCNRVVDRNKNSLVSA